MIKKIVVFGLGWQGKNFLKYFIKNSYKVYGVCKTEKTKAYIENEFGIKVYTNYKYILDNKIDLLILCAFPIGIYDEVLEYSKNYNYSILSDLPITFNSNKLKKYINYEKLFFFLQEVELIFFKKYISNFKYNIIKIECIILQNKENLKKQKNKKESIIIDTHYALNNLLGINLDLLKISYKFVDRLIKDVEYIITIKLNTGFSFIYKYENGKGIVLEKNKNFLIKDIYLIIFDKILEEFLLNIEKNKNLYKVEYYNNFNYLLKKFNHEEK